MYLIKFVAKTVFCSLTLTLCKMELFRLGYCFILYLSNCSFNKSVY